MMLLPVTRWPLRSINTLLLKPLAQFTNLAAARACRPSLLMMVICLVIMLLPACGNHKTEVKPEPAQEKDLIRQSIENSIGWIREKDTALLYSIIADDVNYLEVHPANNVVSVKGSIKNVSTVFIRGYLSLHLLNKAGSVLHTFELPLKDNQSISQGESVSFETILNVANIDVDKFTLLGGIGYRTGRMQIDFAYILAQGKEREKKGYTPPFGFPGKYNLSASIVGLGLTYSF